MDQVYLMYEKCIKEELDSRRLDAITLANAGLYTSPSYSKTSANQKQKMWKQFIDSFDWEKRLNKNKKQSPQELIKVFQKLGVPVVKNKEEKGDL